MSDKWQVLLPLIGVGLAIVAIPWLIIWAAWAIVRRVRRARIEPVARSLGLTYVGKVRRSRLPWLGHLTARFGVWTTPGEHCLEGEFRGKSITLVEHDYTERSRGNDYPGQRGNSWETVARYADAAKGLPNFAVIPAENAEFRFGVGIGRATDVQPGPDAFRTSYRVMSQDRSAGPQIPAGLIDHLSSRPGWSVQVLDEALIVTRRKLRCKPDELEAFLVATSEIADSLSRRAPVIVPTTPGVAEAEQRWANVKQTSLRAGEKNPGPIYLTVGVLVLVAIVWTGMSRGIAFIRGTDPSAAQTATQQATPQAAVASSTGDVSFCAPDEKTWLNARIEGSGRMVSLCSAEPLRTDQGHVQLRIGRPDSLELEFPREREGSQRRFGHAFTGNKDMMYARVWFDVGGYRYVIHHRYRPINDPADRDRAYLTVHLGSQDQEIAKLDLSGITTKEVRALQALLPAMVETPANYDVCSDALLPAPPSVDTSAIVITFENSGGVVVVPVSDGGFAVLRECHGPAFSPDSQAIDFWRVTRRDSTRVDSTRSRLVREGGTWREAKP